MPDAQKKRKSGIKSEDVRPKCLMAAIITFYLQLTNARKMPDLCPTPGIMNC